MESTINFGLEKCIYKEYLKIEMVSHSPTLITYKIRCTLVVHDPLGVRYIFQLSMNPLRNHKKHHNFADTPFDICECNKGVEDTHHFLLAEEMDGIFLLFLGYCHSNWVYYGHRCKDNILNIFSSI